jgi:hypothetical protein
MKRKMIAVLLLVGVCLGVLVVEGVSQPPSAPPTSGFAHTRVDPPFERNVPSSPAPLPPQVDRAPTPATRPAPNFAVVEPRQQEWTFEQLVEALKAVRARQKELQAQEADLLAKMAEKVEEKRKDLNKSEEVLQQLRGEPQQLRSEPSIRTTDAFSIPSPHSTKSVEKKADKLDQKK